MGLVVALLAAFIFLGGISRIASFTAKVVPVMAALYLCGALIVLIMNIGNLPSAVVSIFVGAFCPRALAGSAAGMTVRMAMRYGVARGLFSNEAGMGSTPHAHAIADVKDPEEQGEVAMIGVFIDTFVVLTMTALVILSSGVLDEMILSNTTGTPVARSFCDWPSQLRSEICGCLPPVFRLLHDHRLVLLRTPERKIPLGFQGCASFLTDCGSLCFPGISPEGGSGMESFRPLQWPDGHPEPHRPAGIEWRGGKSSYRVW